jgi:two-component system, OmpR family, response regulator ResD
VNTIVNPSSSPVSVLIVDDDAEFRLLVRMYLANEEFTVSEAEDGNAAFQLTLERTFDLIVLDLIMPGREGLELIQSLKLVSPKARILAVSGVPKRSLYLKAAALLGAGLTLEKPFTPEWFYRNLRQLVSVPSTNDNLSVQPNA